MKAVKWIVVFVVAFLLAWVLIFTFMQEPFKQTASARILFKWTPAIPIYLYVAGSFAIGLFTGLAVAIYNYVTLQAKNHHKTKECLSLQEQVADLSRRLETFKSVESSKLTGPDEVTDVPELLDPPETSAYLTEVPAGQDDPDTGDKENTAEPSGDKS